MYDGSCQHAFFAYKFTGKERDPESGLDNFGARYDSSAMGRFMSPDPDNAGAMLDNPQSWNAYSYVLNNPLNLIDPDGLWCVWEDGTHDDNSDNGGATKTACGSQGGHWDESETVLGLYADKNGNIIGADTTTGSFDFSMTQVLRVTAQQNPVIDLPTMRGVDDVWTIGPDDNWFHSLQFICLGPGVKGFIGGLVLKKDIDALGGAIMGDPSNGDGTAGVGSTLVAAEKGLDTAAESKTAVRAVQSALREEGHRVSQGAIRSGAKFGARLSILAHVGFAANDGREDYRACRE